MSSFEYPALKDLTTSVRLLRIVRKDEPSSNEYLICNCPLGKSQPYSAVSYSWGPAGATREIILNGKPFSVQSSLWNFLWQMRDQKEWNRRWFWIDAICINQQDIKERNMQVSIMRHIYATAENVVVWLGSATIQTDLAMDYIARQNIMILENKTTEISSPQIKPHRFRMLWTMEEGKAFLNLCRRRYWTRAWIVQEIMYARQITLFCGSRNVRWRTFNGIFQRLNSIQVMGWFHMHSYGIEVLESEAAVIFEEKSRWEEYPANLGKGIPIRTLVGAYGHLESTKKVDKVYALAGLCSDEITIDYSLGIEEVYNNILTLACTPQLSTRDEKEIFAKKLSAVLGLSNVGDRLLSVEDIMHRLLKQPEEMAEPETNFYWLAPRRFPRLANYNAILGADAGGVPRNTVRSIRYAQPTVGEPETDIYELAPKPPMHYNTILRYDLGGVPRNIEPGTVPRTIEPRTVPRTIEPRTVPRYTPIYSHPYYTGARYLLPSRRVTPVDQEAPEPRPGSHQDQVPPPPPP
jgi:Heterokaryon incompatibility protein (HET)